MRVLCVLLAAVAASAAGVVGVSDPISPKAKELQQLLLQLLGVDLSDDMAEVLQVCVMDQTPAMAAASNLHFTTVKLSDNDGAAIALLPTPLQEIGGWQQCSTVQARYCLFGAQQAITNICVPAACSTAMLQMLINEVLPAISAAPGIPPAFNVSLAVLQANAILCADDVHEYGNDHSAQATAGIFIAIAVISAVCTAVAVLRDFIAELRTERDVDKSAGEHVQLLPMAGTADGAEPIMTSDTRSADVVWKVVGCWDLRAALSDFMRLSPNRPTNFLNGMRVFSILWVLLGHAVSYPVAPGSDDLIVQLEDLNRYSWVFVTAAVYAVDTFLFMSGFLLAYLLAKSFPRDSTVGTTCVRTGLIYADRYIRLTPFYGLCILFAYNLLQYLCDAPINVMYQHGGDVASGCGEYWWWNMLYINNLKDAPRNGCMVHCWYLGCDMQLFIISVPMVLFYVLSRGVWRYVSFALPGTVLVVSVAWAIAANGSAGSGPYYYSWTRAAPYMYGVLAGLVLATPATRTRVVTWSASRTVRYVVYVLCAGGMWGCMTYQWATLTSTITDGQPTIDSTSWPMWKQHMLQFVYHFVWGLCLSGLALVWSVGHGGWVTRFLGHPVFEPLGKVTYGVYLIHPMVYAVMLSGAQTTTLHYTDVWYMTRWMACSVASFIGAVIAFVFIERPVGAVWDMLSGKKKRRAAREAPQPASQ